MRDFGGVSHAKFPTDISLRQSADSLDHRCRSNGTRLAKIVNAWTERPRRRRITERKIQDARSNRSSVGRPEGNDSEIAKGDCEVS